MPLLSEELAELGVEEVEEVLLVQVVDAQTISSATKVATRNLTGAVATVVEAIAVVETTTTAKVDSMVEVAQAEVRVPTCAETLEVTI